MKQSLQEDKGTKQKGEKKNVEFNFRRSQEV